MIGPKKLSAIRQDRDFVIRNEAGACRTGDCCEEFLRMDRKRSLQAESGNLFMWRSEIKNQTGARETCGKIPVASCFEDDGNNYPQPPGPEQFAAQAKPA